MSVICLFGSEADAKQPLPDSVIFNRRSSLRDSPPRWGDGVSSASHGRLRENTGFTTQYAHVPSKHHLVSM